MCSAFIAARAAISTASLSTCRKLRHGTLTEPDIEAILKEWLERHPEFRGADRDYKIIRATMFLGEEGITTDLVRVTAEFSPDLAAYNPAEDADLYEGFLADREVRQPQEQHRIWIEQCEAAEQIEAEYGTEKALGYLIGEKLLNFLEVAESNPEWRAEIPPFISKIKEIFEPWQIAKFFEAPRRIGVLGHTADDNAHEAFRSQLNESDKVRVISLIVSSRNEHKPTNIV